MTFFHAIGTPPEDKTLAKSSRRASLIGPSAHFLSFGTILFEPGTILLFERRMSPRRIIFESLTGASNATTNLQIAHYI